MFPLSVLLVGLFGFSMLAQEKRGPVLARVNGVEILEEQVQKAASSDLNKLRLTRLQFEAKQKRKIHDVMELGLTRLVEEILLEQEASKRSIEIKALLQIEVDNKVKEPSKKEVLSLYEMHQDRLKKPLEEVSQQLHGYLRQKRYNEVYQIYLNRLKAQSQVQTLLEQERVELQTLGSPSLGPAGAPVTIVEFSDFQCPYCAQVAPIVKKAVLAYPNKLRVVFRQFPLRSIHPQAQKAAEASLCAFDQDHFWEMHDSLFKEFKKLEPEALKARAMQLGLDMKAFNNCLDSDKYAATVQQDVEDGMVAGVSGTPALFVNGRLLSGAQPYEAITRLIEEELKKQESSPGS